MPDEPFDIYALIDLSHCPEPLQQMIHKTVMEYFNVAPLTSSIVLEGDSIARVDFSDPANPRYLSHDVRHYTADAMHFTKEGTEHIAMHMTIGLLKAEIAELRAALRPFAQIVPSGLYPADGSENEGYCVLLAPKHGNPVEYTGGDLARARAAYANHSAPVVEE